MLLTVLSNFPPKAKTALKCPSVRLKIEEAYAASKKGACVSVSFK